MCVIRRMDAVLEPTKRIIDDIAPKVAESTAYRNVRENTPHTARMVHDEALGKVMQLILKDDTQFYKLFVENDAFRRELGDVKKEQIILKEECLMTQPVFSWRGVPQGNHVSEHI